MREVCYTILDIGSSWKTTQLTVKQCLEHGDTHVKATALKEVIVATAAGQTWYTCDSYLMLMIRFVLPEQDHTIKKLLMMLWEVYPMTGADGLLIKEMILVCDSMRRDLQHPNEFVRGATLRFICKLKQPEILEPLVNSVRANLSHRRPYVRRNAILAVYSIHKTYEYLIPDAQQLIEQLLESEKEPACKRNAFIALLHINIDKALSYLLLSLDQVSTFDHCLQMVVVELIQKICRRKSHEKCGFIRCLYTLLDSKSEAVRYEAAKTLPMLTGAPTAVKASICCYVNIIVRAVDLTTRMIVLDRLVNMNNELAHRRILQENIAHMLSLVSRNNDLIIKYKLINLITDLISENNIQQVMNVLQRECSKDEMSTQYTDYKILLANKLHYCYLKFPWTASQVVSFFDDMLTYQTDEKLLIAVLTHLREAAHKFRSITQTITDRLKRTVDKINSAQVYCRSLWILVEFTQNPQHLIDIIELIYETTQGMHQYFSSHGDKNSDDTLVRTYMGKINNNQHVLINHDLQEKTSLKEVIKPLADDIVRNTGYLVTMVSWCATKAFLRFWNCSNGKTTVIDELSNKTMYIVAAMLHLNKLKNNLDSCSRLEEYLHLVNSPNKELVDRLLMESRQALLKMLLKEEEEVNKQDGAYAQQMQQVDDSVSLLQSNSHQLAMSSLTSAMYYNGMEDLLEDTEEKYKLDRVVQLTGLSDSVYCEARLVDNGQHYISLYLSLVNRTTETLFNCCVELAASGDLIITDKPQSKIVAPHQTVHIKINIRISLTGNSLIHGNIVYDTAKATEHATIILQDIPINVVDYMKPTDCSQDDFRKMWLEFEWENKVFLAPKDMANLDQYVCLMATTLNMKILTGAKSSSTKDSRFLTANLHAVSLFEDRVLANLSLEKEHGNIKGHIRFRAQSQGIVLGIGDVLEHVTC